MTTNNKNPETKVLNAVLFEDDPYSREMYTEVLTDLGWTIVGEATNITLALNLIDQLNQLSVELALIDGILVNSFFTHDHSELYRNQGGMVARIIKEKYPHIKTVGVSGDDTFQTVDNNIDAYASKRIVILMNILEEITQKMQSQE